jgi:hypothetical protein
MSASVAEPFLLGGAPNGVAILPGELYPGYPHLAAVAPDAHLGTASELIATGSGRCTMLFTVEAGQAAEAFRGGSLELVKGVLASGAGVLFLCRTQRDRVEVRRRLARIAPAGFSVRE